MEAAKRFETFKDRDLVVGRLLPGTDLAGGLIDACSAHGVRYAVIVSLIGSLRETDFVTIEPEPGSWSGIRYGRPKRVKGGVEIIGAGGMLGEWEDGRPSAHIHYTLMDTGGRIYAGHASESGNPCLVTVEFALRAVDGGSIIRRLDEGLGFPVFTFKP